jgi:ribose 5-phosphate isomerase A
LPVEVVPFGWPVVARRIETLGGKPALRRATDGSGKPYMTDNHNYILDCDFYPIQDPPQLEKDLMMMPGVVEVGLFINLAHVLIIGKSDGTCEVRERV